MPTSANRDGFVLVGGAGFIGNAVAEALCDAGRTVKVLDRLPLPRRSRAREAEWIEVDFLSEAPELPPGHVVLLVGSGNPRPRWPWTLPLDITLTTARLLLRLADREVTLISSIEVYGSAEAPLREDTEPDLPWTAAELASWCDEARTAGRGPCAPWRVAALCRRLADADPSARWTYALAKLAQELIVRDAVAVERLTILRLANAFGIGQERVVTRLARRSLAGRPLPVTEGAVRSFLPVEEVGRLLLEGPRAGTFNVGSPAISLEELARMLRGLTGSASPIVLLPRHASDSCGVVDTGRLCAAGFELSPLSRSLETLVAALRAERPPLFDPPLPVVVPPRSPRPDELADRQQRCLWTGELKHGNRWTRELGAYLRDVLHLEPENELLLTSSGTEALRLAVVGTVGSAAPGDVAVLPSFTYLATAEVLVQLGYSLRFAEVDAATWTLDAAAVERVCSDEAGSVRLVVCVDTFGNPCAYDRLGAVCEAAGAVLVADSAAALGSAYRGAPVGRQAEAHSFSMSFAKVVSAGGAGGAVVFRGSPSFDEEGGWARSALMDELHAVAGLEQISILGDLIERRQRIASMYGAAAVAGGLTSQRLESGCRHSYVHWVARVNGGVARDVLKAELASLGVGTREYFRALHLNGHGPANRGLAVTESLDREVLALPMSSELTEEDADRVVVALGEALEAARAASARTGSLLGG